MKIECSCRWVATRMWVTGYCQTVSVASAWKWEWGRLKLNVFATHTKTYFLINLSYDGSMKNQTAKRWHWWVARFASSKYIASFPGSSVWAEKKEPGTQFTHAQFPQDFWEFGNFRKICSVTPTSARYADFSRRKGACPWPCSLWTMTKERRGHSALLWQELSTCSWIPAKHCSTWLT